MKKERAKRDESRHGDRTVCVVQDRYTGWIDGYPSPSRTSEAIQNHLSHFIGRLESCDLLCFDNAKEYIAAAEALKIRYQTRDKNRPASNGVAERAVRRLLEGSRTVLYDSGLPHCYWSEAVKTYYANRKFHDVIRDAKKTP